jgi:hypothetical protein
VKNSTHSWIDDAWSPVSNPQIPCILENVPEGCKTLDTAKPNPSYNCIPLLTTTDRWKAFGLSETVEHVEVRLTTSSNDRSTFTSAVLSSLKGRMAQISFVLEDDVALTLETTDNKTVLVFVVKTTAASKAAMTKLLQWFLSTADRAQAVFSNYLPGASIIILGTSVTADHSSNNKGLSEGEILLVIVILVIVILGLGALIIWKCFRKKPSNDTRTQLFNLETAADL